MSSPLNAFVDACYIINLDRRKKRFNDTANILKKHGITYTRFSAVDGYTAPVIARFKKLKGKHGFGQFDNAKRKYACHQSHLAILKKAAAAKHERVLILEDDVMLHRNFNALFTQYLAKLPNKNDWKVLLLGANDRDAHVPRKPKPASPWYRATEKTYGAFAMILTRKAILELIPLFERILKPNDVNILAPYYKRNKSKCFVAWPALMIADVGISDLRRGVTLARFGVSRGWQTTLYERPK